MVPLWRITCEEDKYPGMWQRWFRNQCVAVGWPSAKGYHLEGRSIKGQGWATTRKRIGEVQVGDFIVVTLNKSRIGRLGEVVHKRIEDNQWNPLVPANKQLPCGEIGRRIHVRWEMTTGPMDPDIIVQLPQGDQLFNRGESRGAIRRVKSRSLSEIRRVMQNPRNWISLSSRFKDEKALADYIAKYPHRLEDGLMRHPDKRVREMVLSDKKRTDVLLTDAAGLPVIVECKQDAASIAAVRQLAGYMKKIRRELKTKALRGILVHGGPQNIPTTVRQAAEKHGIEIVAYRFRVEFLG